MERDGHPAAAVVGVLAIGIAPVMVKPSSMVAASTGTGRVCALISNDAEPGTVAASRDYVPAQTRPYGKHPD